MSGPGYYRKNRKKVLQRTRRYQQEHAAEITLQKREYYLKNKTRIQAHNREWMRKNREHFNAYKREWRKRRRFPEYLDKYGLTVANWDLLLQRQSGRCGICRCELVPRANFIQIDHCHKTNEVRGLLCIRCNTATGYFKDSLEFLTAAIRWIENGGP